VVELFVTLVDRDRESLPYLVEVVPVLGVDDRANLREVVCDEEFDRVVVLGTRENGEAQGLGQLTELVAGDPTIARPAGLVAAGSSVRDLQHEMGQPAV